jgi:HSP20 family molecular chaperone IbpA
MIFRLISSGRRVRRAGRYPLSSDPSASRSLAPFGGSQLARLTGGAGAPPFFSLLREMDRFVDEAFRGSLGLADRGGSKATAITPRINVSETDQEIRIEAEMPGFPAENVQVEVIDDVLTIRGEQREEHEGDRGETQEQSGGSSDAGPAEDDKKSKAAQ